ncbi:MAG: NAD(P)H-hydrate epimerase [Candidatus Hydrogenedentota bacterium]
MQVLTVEQMREADRRAIEVLGIPSTVLMDRAGQAVFSYISGGPVVIVCGKGNNGGDGFVVARYCLLAGYDTSVIVLAREDELSKDARIFRKVYTRLGGQCFEATSDSEVIAAFERQPASLVWVDAMLGTGTHGDVRGIVRTAIDHWRKARTIAVDIPSGLNADTGQVCGAAIVADETVTIQFLKIGFEVAKAKHFLGNVHVVDIGIPEVCGDDEAWKRLDF